jgi:hypothetical protein
MIIVVNHTTLIERQVEVAIDYESTSSTLWLLRMKIVPGCEEVAVAGHVEQSLLE